MSITTEEFIAAAIEEGVIAASQIAISRLDDALTMTKNGGIQESEIVDEYYEDPETQLQIATEAAYLLGQELQHIDV